MSTPTSLKVVQPYLNFNGRCDEAVEFYRKAVGAEVEMLMRFKDSPEPAGEGCGENANIDPNQVMHVSLRIGGSTVMASDCGCTGSAEFKGFSLSLGLSSVEDAERYFAALADGGTVHMPLEKTFWSPSFGVVADRFGVSWMINVIPAQG